MNVCYIDTPFSLSPSIICRVFKQKNNLFKYFVHLSSLQGKKPQSLIFPVVWKKKSYLFTLFFCVWGKLLIFTSNFLTLYASYTIDYIYDSNRATEQSRFFVNSYILLYLIVKIQGIFKILTNLTGVAGSNIGVPFFFTAIVRNP